MRVRFTIASSGWDGRWLAVALLAGYFAFVLSAGTSEGIACRWRQVGVYAYATPFADLQVFPAIRSTLAAGGSLYGANPADPFHRPYNYPRLWLTFMRFPASPAILRGLGSLLAAGAIVLLLTFWGRLSPWQGMLAGLLLCSPAFQLGVERGNTDLAMLALVIGGLWLAAATSSERQKHALWPWLAAALLKLYPILVLGAWFDGSWKAWWRRVWMPLAAFGAYLALTWTDVGAILQRTGSGWVESYGATAPIKTLEQVLSYHQLRMPPLAGLIWGSRLAAAAVAGWALLHGRHTRGLNEPAAPDQAAQRRALLGFRISAIIYLGTFLTGSNFDYRQIFLLLALPQLFHWRSLPIHTALPTLALGALIFSLGVNYLLAGWAGCLLNELGDWVLLFAMTALLAATWRQTQTAL